VAETGNFSGSGFMTFTLPLGRFFFIGVIVTFGEAP
jgi:hypothetical protein